MATALPAPSLAPFDLDLDRSNVGYRWKEWVERFENYLVAMNINDDKRQKALLLLYGGDEIFKLSKTLDMTPRPAAGQGAAAVPAETQFAAAKRVLTEHFHPKANAQFNRLAFRQANQQKDESLDQFYARVKNLSEGCEHTDNDAEIRTQLMCGTSSTSFRKLILQEPTLSLEQLLTKGRAQEKADIQLPIFDRQNGSSSSTQTNALRSNSRSGNNNNNGARPKQGNRRNRDRSRGDKRDNRNHHKNSSSDKSCPYCGGQYHSDGLSSCPARGKKCNHCKNRDHFESQCRVKKEEEKKKKSQAPKRNVRFTTSRNQDDSSSDDDDHYTFATSAPKECCPSSSIIINNNKKEKFLLDSGSTSTLIGRDDFNRLENVKLKPTNRKIYPFGQKTPLELDGYFVAQLSIPDSKKRVTEDVYVTSSSNRANILSCYASQELGLIKFAKDVQLNSLSHQLQAPQLQAPQLQASQQESTQHAPLSKMTGIKVKLHLDHDVPPVVQPHRRIPFHYREWLDKELEKFEQQGVIERVTEPSPWVSPITIAEKPGKPLRLCVDMRQANKAIKRTRHVLPTLEDIISQVTGSQFFSVVDLMQGYHQLELEPNSRPITSFSTHKGLWRYKRLFFGVNCASEIFNNILREVLSGLPGVINAMDDILIHGRTEAEHDKRLQKALARLNKNNLTIREKKSQIKQKEVTFWGVILSGKGISIDQNKVAAVSAFKQPTNVSETKSFIGMTNYCSKFLHHYADLSAPLRELANKKESEFNWTKQCDTAFNTLKKLMCEAPTLSFYDTKKKTELVVDASPIGLGAILMQYGTDEKQKNVVAYSSRALTPVERRYSQTEREALAIIWSMELFRFYLLGTSFVVWTDHKPLVSMFNKASSKLSPRMERWMLRKQPFNVVVKYMPGQYNAADFFVTSSHQSPQEH